MNVRSLFHLIRAIVREVLNRANSGVRVVNLGMRIVSHVAPAKAGASGGVRTAQSERAGPEAPAFAGATTIPAFPLNFTELWTAFVSPFFYLRAFAPLREKEENWFTQRRKGAKKKRVAAALLLAALPVPAVAQEHDHSAMGHEPAENDVVIASIVPPLPSQGSGTSRLPGNEGGHHSGLHISAGNNWMLMLHGYASGVHTSQSGPRGDSKTYVQSMAMLTAEKETSFGRVQLKSMFSVEPLMNNSGYPNLFATGETNGGEPLIDRQHPHDLFMELAARVDFNLGSNRLFLYGGPVGEPALGPSAFMHRGSAKLNPEAPITHHWFDSTHITYGVATAGFASRKLQLEASLFTGREPDEKRWNIEKPRFDSWSVRATWNPSPKWALQASHGRLKNPEFLIHPGENEHRTTASAHFANGKGFSAMLAFSAKNRDPGGTLTAWLAEANWDIDDHHTLFGRIENVKNDELFPEHTDPLHEVPFRVSKAQIGYAYRMPLTGPLNLALGGTVSAFAKPAALDAAYGKNPVGATLFAKLSLGIDFPRHPREGGGLSESPHHAVGTHWS